MGAALWGVWHTLSKAALHVSFLCSKLPKSTEWTAGFWMRSLHVFLVLPYHEVEVTTRCVANMDLRDCGTSGSSLPRHSLLHFQHTKRKLCYKEPTPIPTSQDTHSCQKSVYRAMPMRDAYKGSFRSLSFWCTMHTLSLSLGHFMSSVFMICMCYVRMCYVCAMYVCMYLTLDCLCTYVCVYVSVCVNTVLKYSSSERSYSL